ncbi:sulfotransferase domain-containing protein [Micromonospora sp. KC606]|uniref:sulfotransferase domain-containing protein n=1 Tax=Micromonospora sp. KC606 TaxID=2530379 RepID=UPI001051A429|nr:sulfotransferase domain-containing protein [Micromonospora sp. KC606]TDC85630.1 sulfotransferase domain-containing protein [Micromonospora sp. KC606]
MPTPVRYRSADEDSARWLDFAFRPGDIVISTRSKSGTTWMQMICALLVLRTADLPAALPHLSPWLDWLVVPQQQVYDHLAAQQHRRFIKTHTPLDGVPFDARVAFIVVARHPLDMAVSLYHQGDNIDRGRLRQLTGAPPPSEPEPVRRPLHPWLLDWIAGDPDPRQALDSLPGVMWHLRDAWQRRHEPNVLLVHYDDLRSDLGAEMQRIAAWLDIGVPAGLWPELVRAASFDRMRQRASDLAPDSGGVLKDHRAFFRAGRSGAGRDVLSAEELNSYHERTAQLAPPDLLAWLHRQP